jgi:hypothetical protein
LDKAILDQTESILMDIDSTELRQSPFSSRSTPFSYRKSTPGRASSDSSPFPKLTPRVLNNDKKSPKFASLGKMRDSLAPFFKSTPTSVVTVDYNTPGSNFSVEVGSPLAKAAESPAEVKRPIRKHRDSVAAFFDNISNSDGEESVVLEPAIEKPRDSIANFFNDNALSSGDTNIPISPLIKSSFNETINTEYDLEAEIQDIKTTIEKRPKLTGRDSLAPFFKMDEYENSDFESMLLDESQGYIFLI